MKDYRELAIKTLCEEEGCIVEELMTMFYQEDITIEIIAQKILASMEKVEVDYEEGYVEFSTPVSEEELTRLMKYGGINQAIARIDIAIGNLLEAPASSKGISYEWSSDVVDGNVITAYWNN